MMRWYKYVLCLLCSGWMLCSSAHAQVSRGGVPLPLSENTALRRTVSSEVKFHPILLDSSFVLPESTDRRLYTGQVGQLNLSPDNSGQILSTENEQIWRVGVCSPGAVGIGLIFTNFELSENAYFYVYNPDQTQVIGAFGADNNNPNRILPVQMLESDSLIVELHEPWEEAGHSVLRLGEAVHHYRRSHDFYEAGACSPHALWDASVGEEHRAVCALNVSGTKLSWWGSGCLLNNPEKKPYLYTAAHNEDEAVCPARTILYFNYAVSRQDSLTQPSEEFTMAGTTCLAQSAALDFCLLELNQEPPRSYRPYYAGWSRTTQPESELISIQHPRGDIKRVSHLNHIPTFGTFDGPMPEKPIPNSFWYINRWTKGTTEAGSSGSPLITADKKVIGALTGGQSECQSPVSDYYSRLDVSWNYYTEYNKQLKHWLDPYNVNLQKMDGVDPYASDPCYRVTNTGNTEDLEKLYMSNPKNGLLAGHNSLGYTEYAEKFSLTKQALVAGVVVIPSIGQYNSNSPVYLRIYCGTNSPETLLAESLIHPKRPVCNPATGEIWYVDKSLWTHKECYVPFAKEVQVDTNFFIAYSIQYNPVDSFAVYQVAYRNGVNTAYYRDKTGWKPFTEHPDRPMSSGLWIEPILHYDQASSVDSLPDSPQARFAASPNPSTGWVELTGGTAEIPDYQVFDAQGRTLLRGQGRQVHLPVPPGWYLLRVSDSQGSETLKVLRK